MASDTILVNPRKLGLRGFFREMANARRTGPVPETVFRLQHSRVGRKHFSLRSPYA